MNTQKLRGLALGATQGEWDIDCETDCYTEGAHIMSENGGAIAGVWVTGELADQNTQNAAYIAFACPANILALLDSHAELLDIANECHKIIKELCACYSHHEPLATLERIEAITKAEAL